MNIIKGRTALITGAASGIGRAIALALAREGADLCLLDIDVESLSRVASEAEALGVTVAARRCDLSQPAQISAVVANLIATAGPIHILINSAGIVYYGHTHDMDAELWHNILSVNLSAPVQLIRELMPTLNAQDEAHIVNVCSLFGLVTLRKGAAYQATKFGLVGFTAALRAEYGNYRFGVTALCPGFVRTPFLERFLSSPGHPRHKVPNWATISPDYLANRTIRAIRRNEAIVVTPSLAWLLWWLARLSPRLADRATRGTWRRRPKR